jgi:hypothetical protein
MMPRTMPLIPAIRPSNAINSTADSPMTAPPISAEPGVKFSIPTSKIAHPP